MAMYTNIKFSWTDKGEIVQIFFILKLEPDLDPEPEKLIEHGAQRFFWYFKSLLLSNETDHSAPKN